MDVFRKLCLLIITPCLSIWLGFTATTAPAQEKLPRLLKVERGSKSEARVRRLPDIVALDKGRTSPPSRTVRADAQLMSGHEVVQDDAAALPPTPPTLSQELQVEESIAVPATRNNVHGCNTLGPYAPCPVRGFHCIGCPDCPRKHTTGSFFIDSIPWRALGHGRWQGAGPIPWEAFGHGEYIGPARTAHVPEYRLRVDDQLDFVFRLTREASAEPYRLEVGDQIKVESLTSTELDIDAIVQPDGSITLRLLGQVPAYGLTLAELRDDLERRFKNFIQEPSITVAPITINTRLEELRATVDNRFGRGGQSIFARVTPEGTLQLPAIGSVYAQGLNMDELKKEIDARYRKIVPGLEVTPILQERAPRFVYVVGEVAVPGRYTLEAPTSVMQAIALAGGWNVGGNLNHVVVFRRDENWNLMATKLDIFGALYGKEPCPADEIWLRDSDIVLVPKRAILVADEVIELFFTRGLYGVIPLDFSVNFAKLSSI